MFTRSLICIFIVLSILLVISILGIFTHPFAWIILIPTAIVYISFLWKTIKVIHEVEDVDD